MRENNLRLKKVHKASKLDGYVRGLSGSTRIMEPSFYNSACDPNTLNCGPVLSQLNDPKLRNPTTYLTPLLPTCETTTQKPRWIQAAPPSFNNSQSTKLNYTLFTNLCFEMSTKSSKPFISTRFP
jgi:hypothetical protein